MSAPTLPDEPGGLRPALNWFHTWFGLFIGGLLFVIFWTGALSVFDREIDRWMMPSTRLSAPPAMSVDALLPVVEDDIAGARGWRIILPDERTPVATAEISGADGSYIRRYIHPYTLEILPDEATYGATEFIYPYHYRLNSGRWGLFLCAFAAVVMTALCVSGVIIHRKIFADFFTLRVVRKAQRTTLDLHNLSGVLTLPFLLMISFSGIAIFTYSYLPSAQAIVFGNHPEELAGGYFSRPPAEEPGSSMVSLDMLRDKAAAYWGSEPPRYVQVVHPGDANAYVEIRPDSDRTISMSTQAIWFDAASGNLLATSPVTATRRAYDFLYGIHLVQFDHWTLRWLYFLSGLSGCVLIGTGLLFWVQSRRKRHEKLGLRGVWLAEAFTIGVTTGLLIATLSFLIANRLLPNGLADRASWEVRLFQIVWLSAIVHAFVRRRSAWREQAWVISVGCLLALLLNAITTGEGPTVTVAQGLSHTTGVDLTLLVSATAAAAAALKLRRREHLQAAQELS